jgi:hypothetical protein
VCLPPQLPITVRPPSKLISIVAFVAAVAWSTAAAAAPAPPMTVALHQPSGTPLSYFQLQARPGLQVSAGTLELRNRRGRPVTVLVDPIGAVTATTLGSAYDVRGLSIRGPAGWTRLASRRLVLAPHGTANVAVTVLPPRSAGPGDYLSGIGVQALGSPQPTNVGANVAISSTQRYAIGVEVRLPGPRHPLIRLTRASITRDPAGVAFSIFGRNAGNVILQNVHGSALITQGPRVVARIPMGPGTFVTGTSIAYPVPTPREQPRQGEVYRVRAVLHHPGGVARLDTLVRFGRLDALRQQSFGGPKAPPEHGGFPALLAALAVIALGALAAALLWWRRRAGARSLPTLGRALAAARENGEPLSVILVAAEAGGAASRRVASVLRSRLRRTDRLCRLDGRGFLVVAPDTDPETANVLAADLRRHLDRANGRLNGVAIDVHAANGDATAAELLARVTHTNGGTRTPAPAN